MERRKHMRYPYIAIISHDILSPEAAPAGKMYNLSQTGLYFESKHSFRAGEEVFVEVIGHPQSHAELELLFDVKIIWGRKSKGTLFPHGYGARFNQPLTSIKKLFENNQADSGASGLKASDQSKRFDARHSPRRAYRKPMFFNYKNNVCRGLVTDISRGGAFINTTARISLGYRIHLVIASSVPGKKVKLRGWVVRLTPKGFAVSFNRRSGSERRFDLDRRTGFDRRERPKPENPP